MKYLLFILPVSFFVLSCSSLKPATSSADAYNNQEKTSSIKFIDNISINAQPHNSSSSASRIKPQQFNSPSLSSKIDHGFSIIETYSSVQFKYAILTDVPVEEMNNEKLLQFMEEWYGAKYHFGGNSKDGIDCSAFASLLMTSVYGINNLPRMAKDQYIATSRISKRKLREGDLVFFHTYGKKKKKVTHVGVYLCNNKFVHASVSGVMISDMSDGYYSKHFVGAGRATDLSVVSSR
ncbi:MAG TPA: NlpC/P60 family protein [Puia sp.]|nr:NlpC/P60 family protein [Puia sp.]